MGVPSEIAFCVTQITPVLRTLGGTSRSLDASKATYFFCLCIRWCLVIKAISNMTPTLRLKSGLQRCSTILSAAYQACRAQSVVIHKRLFPFHASAWHLLIKPVDQLLAEGDAAECDRLTTQWRDHMQSQLNVILLTVSCQHKHGMGQSSQRLTTLKSAVVASVVASSFSWPMLDTTHDPMNNDFNVLVLGACYAALAVAICAIACGAQLSLALSRISTCRTGLSRLRHLLAKDGLAVPPRASFAKMYLWQIPAALLNLSIYLYLAGPVVLAYTSAANMLRAQPIRYGIVVSRPSRWILSGSALTCYRSLLVLHLRVCTESCTISCVPYTSIGV